MEWTGKNASDPFVPMVPLFSRRVTSISIFVLNIIGVPLLSVGIIANIINLVVFVKQGFTESINVSLTSLTVSDLSCLVHMLWQVVTLFPSIQNTDLPFSPNEVLILTGSIPRIYYSRVSSLITVYISIERCISVIKPLQVKFVFTRKRLTASMVGFYVFNALPIVPFYYTTRLAWKPHPEKNQSYLGVVFVKNSKLVDDLGMVLGILISFSTFIIIAVCAVTLVLTLSKHNRWRTTASTTTASKKTPVKFSTKKNKNDLDAGTSSKDATIEQSKEGSSSSGGNTKKSGSSMSDRDKRAAKTVTLLAFMFVFCYFPGVVCQLAMLMLPEFSRRGRYRNAYTLFWLISLRAEGLCASANILVYFNTSTKYRETFLRVFCPCQKNKPTSSSQ